MNGMPYEGLSFAWSDNSGVDDMDRNHTSCLEISGIIEGDIPDFDLVGMAVLNARDLYSSRGTRHPRWLGVMDAFGITKDQAFALCAKHGADPNEVLVS